MRTKQILKRAILLAGLTTTVSLNLFAQSPWAGLQGLSGTWKRLGKSQYESWKPASSAVLEGEGFKLTQSGERKVTEHLKIVLKDDGSIVYQATVPDQNDSATIEFPLTFFTADSWTFENPKHDFPQKIEYWVSGELMRATLSGEGNEFTWEFNKVEEPQPLPVSLQGYTLFVSSRNTGTVKRFDAFSGNYLGEFGREQIGNETQDVAIGPDNMLYVTSLQSPYILKFDPATGAFLGNFSQGYELQRPTKISFHSDGFVYVSQWGENQTGVVRFDARTGQFDRDCTGPLAGPLDHNWDAAGNLYVACFFSKDIRKFNPEGQFLGIATPPEALKGPSHVWLDKNGDMLVADWDTGAIKKFQRESDAFRFQNDFASGFARLEGLAFGPDGYLYACDWHLNLVKKLDAATGTEIGVYLEGGGMLQPNGLVFWKK